MSGLDTDGSGDGWLEEDREDIRRCVRTSS